MMLIRCILATALALGACHVPEENRLLQMQTFEHGELGARKQRDTLLQAQQMQQVVEAFAQKATAGKLDNETRALIVEMSNELQTVRTELLGDHDRDQSALNELALAADACNDFKQYFNRISVIPAEIAVGEGRSMHEECRQAQSEMLIPLNHKWKELSDARAAFSLSSAPNFVGPQPVEGEDQGAHVFHATKGSTLVYEEWLNQSAADLLQQLSAIQSLKVAYETLHKNYTEKEVECSGLLTAFETSACKQVDVTCSMCTSYKDCSTVRIAAYDEAESRVKEILPHRDLEVKTFNIVGCFLDALTNIAFNMTNDADAQERIKLVEECHNLEHQPLEIVFPGTEEPLECDPILEKPCDSSFNSKYGYGNLFGHDDFACQECSQTEFDECAKVNTTVPPCADECVHGTVVGNMAEDTCGCDCDHGWQGVLCNTEAPCASSPEWTCSGNGHAHGTIPQNNCKCNCDHGYDGLTCENEIPCSEHHSCSGHGTSKGSIADNTCSCDCEEGYEGDACENAIKCSSATEGHTCSGHGQHTGTVAGNDCGCECDHGWDGNECGHPIPCGDCGAHGLASGSVAENSCACNCDDGWEGDDCATPEPCNIQCEHGTVLGAVPGNDCQCECEAGWTGDDCSSQHTSLVGCLGPPSGWSRPYKDVPTTAAGALECKAACKTRNYAYFGMECPHFHGSRAEVHCQCHNNAKSGTQRDSSWCRGQGMPQHWHCVGPYEVDGWLMGDANVGSVYSTD